MKAGDLRERVAFDAPTSASDGYGGTVDGWTETFACWANFRYLRGGERVMADRLAGVQPIIATIRQGTAAEAITAGHRMRDVRTGTVYNVRTNVPMQDDRGFRELLCESGVAS